MTSSKSILFIALAFLYSIGVCLLEVLLQKLHVSESIIAQIACTHNLITCTACAYLFTRGVGGKARWWWAGSFALVGLADVLHGLLRWVPPFAFHAGAAYAADHLYTAVLILLAIACLKSFKPIRGNADGYFILLAATICCLGLTFGLTKPIIARGYSFSFLISEIGYNLAVGILTGVLLLSGLQTRKPAGLALVSSLLLVLCSDFAIRFYDYVPEVPTLSLFNYGWELGFSFIGVTALWLTLSRADISSLYETIPTRSIRYDIALVSLVALCLFALVFIMVGHGSMTISTADISLLLFAFLVSWVMSNASALWISSHISRFKSSIGHGEGDIADLGIEIAELLKVYQLKADELATVLEKVKQHKAIIEASLHHIAHDMRSPLAVLKSYTSCVQPAGDDKDGKEFQSAAERSVAKLLRMTDEIVESAKVGTLSRGTTDVARLLHEQVLPEVRLSSMLRTTLLELDMRCSLQCNLDVNKIGHVLINLIVNAAQAIEHERGRISIIVRAVQNHLTISVTDNGRGISPEHLSLVFDEFFTFGKVKATGLGLAYCKRVVEAHGGSLKVQSDPGSGTTFTICIPNCVVTGEEATAHAKTRRPIDASLLPQH